MSKHIKGQDRIKTPHYFTKWEELLNELKWFERDERRIRERKKDTKFKPSPDFLFYTYQKKKKKKLASTNVHAIRNSVEYDLWREAVFSRDNWTCQKCIQRGGILHAHHIFNFATHLDLRFAIDNGITLCKKCHKEFHKIYGNKNNTWEQLSEFLNN